jgi:hypothetical protein
LVVHFDRNSRQSSGSVILPAKGNQYDRVRWWNLGLILPVNAKRIPLNMAHFCMVSREKTQIGRQASVGEAMFHFGIGIAQWTLA